MSRGRRARSVAAASVRARPAESNRAPSVSPADGRTPRTTVGACLQDAQRSSSRLAQGCARSCSGGSTGGRRARARRRRAHHVAQATRHPLGDVRFAAASARMRGAIIIAAAGGRAAATDGTESDRTVQKAARRRAHGGRAAATDGTESDRTVQKAARCCGEGRGAEASLRKNRHPDSSCMGVGRNGGHCAARLPRASRRGTVRRHGGTGEREAMIGGGRAIRSRPSGATDRQGHGAPHMGGMSVGRRQRRFSAAVPCSGGGMGAHQGGAQFGSARHGHARRSSPSARAGAAATRLGGRVEATRCSGGNETGLERHRSSHPPAPPRRGENVTGIGDAEAALAGGGIVRARAPIGRPHASPCARRFAGARHEAPRRTDGRSDGRMRLVGVRAACSGRAKGAARRAGSRRRGGVMKRSVGARRAERGSGTAPPDTPP